MDDLAVLAVDMVLAVDIAVFRLDDDYFLLALGMVDGNEIRSFLALGMADGNEIRSYLVLVVVTADGDVAEVLRFQAVVHDFHFSIVGLSLL